MTNSQDGAVREAIEHAYHIRFNRKSPFQISPSAVSAEILAALDKAGFAVIRKELIEEAATECEWLNDLSGKYDGVGYTANDCGLRLRAAIWQGGE